jgi:hypothetical protein
MHGRQDRSMPVPEIDGEQSPAGLRRTTSGELMRALSVRRRHRSTPQVVRKWFAPMVVVVVVALLLSTSFYAVDLFFFDGLVTGAPGVLEHYLAFTPELITDALPSLGMTVVAALGIVLTVIAIIVQLSAERYTAVAMMFLRDPVHVVVLSFYVVASLCAVWLSVTLRVDFVPRSLLLVVMCLTSVGLATMLPYFAYTFWFLEPGNIIERLRLRTRQLSQKGFRVTSEAEAAPLQGELLTQIEEIADIAKNSIDGQDKIIAMTSVDALRDFLMEYVAKRPAEERAWYRVSEALEHKPDFAGLDRQLREELDGRGLWVEWKVLNEYTSVYREAMTGMPEVSCAIAINTRYIGEVAARADNEDLVRMVLRFLNLYLQRAIDGSLAGVACEVLNQYRMLLNEMLHLGQDDAACDGVGFLFYYGQIAFEADMPAVTETVAYDVARLCQCAHENRLPGENCILRQLLDLDDADTAFTRRQQRTLRGVRHAQARLALYYLSVGEQTKARLIADDMRDMAQSQRQALHEDMLRAAPPHLWEVVDRGRTLHHLTQQERAELDVFFGWLSAGG